MTTEENPYTYYDKQVGVKIKFLILDANRKHPDSLCLYKYRNLYNQMNSDKSCLARLGGRSCFASEAMVLLSSLDRVTKDALTQKFGKPKEEIKKSWFADHYQHDSNAFEFYVKHTYGDDQKKLDLADVEECTFNASVLNTVMLMKTNRQQYLKGNNITTVDIWQSLSNDVNAFREVAHNLPTTKDGLRRKTVQYAKEGYKAVISGKFGMRNAVKVKLKEQEALLDELIAKHTNLDNTLICHIYNAVAEQLTWLPITPQTVANRKKQSNLVTYAGRNSGSALSNNVLMQHRRTAPTAPMLYWTLDGWDAELLYQKTTTNQKGYATTTYHNRLTMVVVLDAYNKYPIGYAIGSAESPELIKQALRNAINHTTELFGDRYNPQQLQSDNYQSKNLTPTYQAITKLYTPAKVKNAKAKIIEPYFSHINKNYCRLMDNWSGYNINSGSKNQPNVEVMNKISKFFPDEAGVRSQLETIIRTERAKKQAQYVAQWATVPADLKIKMSAESYYLALGQTSGSTNRLTGSGLHLTINGSKQAYDCFDMKFRQQSHQDWTVLYDDADPTQVLAISKCQQFRFLLDQKHAGAMAIVERTEKDFEVYTRINAFNHTTLDYITEQRQESAELVEGLMQNPLLEDTLAKHLLVDSRGQHKDQRNRNRLEHNGAKQIIKAERAETKATERSWQDDQDDYINNKVDFSQYLNLSV